MQTAAFVPSDLRRYLSENFTTYRLFKYLRRKLFMRLSGQQSLIVNHIAESDTSILWINYSAPSLGDALMDTAARVLLAGRQVDLLTSNKNKGLFARDLYFSAAYDETQLEVIQENHYDLCIVDAFSPRSVNLKRQVCPLTPMVGLYGFINGYEIHRTQFSFHRLSTLLGQEAQPESDIRLTLAKRGVQSSGLEVSRYSSEARGQSICFGVGGEWGFRTYRRWAECISLVHRLLPDYWDIRLVGSKNGVADGSRIESECRSLGRRRIINLIGKTSLDELIDTLRSSAFYVGADGGTWHISSALGLPSVVLFADCQLFDESGNRLGRESPGQLCTGLHAEENVNEIRPERIASALEQLIKRIGLLDREA